MPRKPAAQSNRSGIAYKGVPLEKLTKPLLIEVVKAMRAKIIQLENERLQDTELLR